MKSGRAWIDARVGTDVPIVITLDLHGILTDRMLRQIDGLAIELAERQVAFGRLRTLIPQFAQDLTDACADVGIVVDDQH